MAQKERVGLIQKVHDAICPCDHIKPLNRLKSYCPLGLMVRRIGAKGG
jgi:hypothetical protein